jgi:hypothetical protein
MTDWRNILEDAVTPAALISFGKDSMLLLELMREVRTDFDVIHFGPVSKFAENIIKQYDLTVYSWNPAQRSILIDGDTTVLVDDYSFGGELMPVIQDIEPNDVCCGTVNDKPPLMDWAYNWSDTFLGWKATDSHPIFANQPHIIDGMPFGNTKLYAPLRDLTDSDVFQALFERGIVVPPENGSVNLCTRCLRNEATFCPMVGAEIPPHTWSPADSLAAFQARFR